MCKVLELLTTYDFDKVDSRMLQYKKDVLTRGVNSLDKLQSSEIAKYYLKAILLHPQPTKDDLRKMIECKCIKILSYIYIAFLNEQ